MRTRFCLGTSHRAAAFRAKIQVDGFRPDPMLEKLNNAIIASMDDCLTVARKEVGYSDKRMEGAKEMCFNCPEVIDFECLKTKSGRISATVRWVTAKTDRENQTPASHENGYRFAKTMYDYLKQYIQDAIDGKSPKWLKLMDVRAEGFEP